MSCAYTDGSAEWLSRLTAHMRKFSNKSTLFYLFDFFIFYQKPILTSPGSNAQEEHRF